LSGYVQRYRKPPITEAVIELRFAEAASDRDLEEANRAFRSDYAREDRVANVEEIEVNMKSEYPGGPPKPNFGSKVQVGYKRSNPDSTEILLFYPRSIVISQLAPYPGWEAFLGRFNRDFAKAKAKLGFRSMNRLGVRFINRLDVPMRADGLVYEEEYVSLRIAAPDMLGPFLASALQAKFQATDIGCTINLNAGILDSPLAGHISILLDIDVSRERNVPSKDDEMLDLLDKIRVRKNEVFEACVTDKARALFS
jgi:uncharacterized protein (TIGR04255 family)